MKNYLEFESDIKSLEEQLDKLKDPFNNEGLAEVDTKKINQIQSELDQKLKEVYSNLSRWQRTLLARHEDRPRAKFFINYLFSNFINLSGDRQFAEDKSVLAGFGVFEDQSVLVIGQEKGDDLDSRIERNFGMMRPEGYRKCIRLMQLADKFNIPIISFIDTPGAYPGIGAEERGQAQAIAENLFEMSMLKVPIISIVIGEGASGGALAIALCDRLICMENTWFSVISPEGCASILFRDSLKANLAADSMRVTSDDLMKLKIADSLIKEPLGGAHSNYKESAISLKNSFLTNLSEVENLDKNELIALRLKKYDKIGSWVGK